MNPGEPVITTTTDPTGLAFYILVTPRSRRPGIGGEHDGALRVQVAEPPESGRANAACVKAIAEALGVRRGDVSLDPASRQRRKHVVVAGERQALTARLAELAAADAKS
jgi:uncharacterized protein YggU (UPF0235/DUF167 family)